MQTPLRITRAWSASEAPSLALQARDLEKLGCEFKDVWHTVVRSWRKRVGGLLCADPFEPVVKGAADTLQYVETPQDYNYYRQDDKKADPFHDGFSLVRSVLKRIST